MYSVACLNSSRCVLGQRQLRIHQSPARIYRLMTVLMILFQASTSSACSTTTNDSTTCTASPQDSSARASHRSADGIADITSGSLSGGVVDYFNEQSALEFSRTYKSSMGRPFSALGPRWRHTYDIVLARDDSDRIIFNSDGRRIMFRTTLTDSSSDLSVDPSDSPSVNNKNNSQPSDQPEQIVVGVFSAVNPADGQLHETQTGHVWNTRNGWRYRFHGAHLVAMEHQSGKNLSIYYRDKRISSVTDERGRQIQFHYDGARLSSLALPDGRTLVYAYSPAGILRSFQSASGDSVQYKYNFQDSNAELSMVSSLATNECQAESTNTTGTDTEIDQVNEQGQLPTTPHNPDPSIAIAEQSPDAEQTEVDSCDTTQNPPAENFFSEVYIPGAVRVDARAASCESYFIEFYGTERGSEIETGFEQHARYAQAQATVRSFPIVDFLLNGEALVIRSRDLTSASYNNPDDADALYQRLLRDGSEINQLLLQPLMEQETIMVTEQGDSTSITQADVQVVVLELVIQAGMASAEHIAQMQRAAQELAARWNIILRIIEIP